LTYSSHCEKFYRSEHSEFSDGKGKGLNEKFASTKQDFLFFFKINRLTVQKLLINLPLPNKNNPKMAHFTSSNYEGGMAFTSFLNGFPLTTDTAIDADGTNKGPRPKALMLLALSGCTGVDIVSILNKMRVNFSDLSIDVQGDLTDEEAAIYNTVTVTYKIKVAEADEAKVEKAVTLSQDKYCGVAAMFRKFAELKKEIVYL